MSLRRSSIATIITLGFVKILSILRDLIVIGYFGFGHQADIYLVSYFIPVSLFGIISYGLSTVLMPQWIKYQISDSLSMFLGNITSTIFTIGLLISFAIYMSARLITLIIVPGYDISAQIQVAQFLKWQSLSIVAILLVGIFKSYLQFRGKYVLSEIFAVVPSIAILITFPFAIKYGLIVSIVGYVCGAIIQVIILFLLVISEQNMTWSFSLYRKILKLIFKIPPFFIGVSGGALTLYGLQVIISYLPEGSMSAYSIAMRMISIPTEIIVGSIAIVLYPSFTKHIAVKDVENIKIIFKKGMYMAACFLSPLLCVLCLYSDRIMIFIDRLYSVNNIEIIAKIIPILAITFIFQPILQLSTRVIYAQGKTWTPSFIGISATLVIISASSILSIYYGLKGIAFGQLAGLGIAMLLIIMQIEKVLKLRYEPVFILTYIMIYAVPIVSLY